MELIRRALVALALIAAAGAAQAQVSVVNSYAYTTWTNDSAAQTQAVDCTGANYVLVVAMARDSVLASRTVTVTHAGNSVPSLSVVHDDANRTRVEMFGLASPTSGSQNVVVTPGGTSNGNFFVYCLSGVNASPVGQQGDFTIDSTSPEGVTITGTTSGSLVIDGFYPSSSTAGGIAAGTNQTGLGSGLFWSSREASSGGSITMDWTFSSGSIFEGAGTAVEILASAGGGSTILPKMMQLLSALPANDERFATEPVAANSR